MEEEIRKSVFEELHALILRVDELERQVASVMTAVQQHAGALKVILTAAKVAHDKETQHDANGKVPGGLPG